MAPPAILSPFMEIGSEWIVEAGGCREETLRDAGVLGTVFTEVLRDLDLHPLHDPAWHVFPGAGGITGFVMLTESHLACHTYPEHGIATFNLYCCKPRPAWDWDERLRALLGAREVRVRLIPRTLEDRPTRETREAESAFA